MKKIAPKKIITRFVVRRERWLRGGECESALNIRGKFCCLGFLGLACGASPKDLVGRDTPRDAIGIVPWPKGLVSGRSRSDTRLGDSIVAVNDDGKYEEDVREARLTMLFKKIGITVVFRGKKK